MTREMASEIRADASFSLSDLSSLVIFFRFEVLDLLAKSKRISTCTAHASWLVSTQSRAVEMKE